MSTPVRDPFEDLLDMGEDEIGVESPPPLPASQPPKSDSWMVLSKGADDFKSMNDSDLFGSGSSSMKSSHTDDTGDLFSSTSSKGGTKAHGSTFNDLFDGGPPDKRTKKSTSSHGSTFDDLFEESKPSGSSGSAIDDLFGSVKSSTVSGADSSLDDLFGSGSAKQSTQAASKSNGSQLVDLFGDSESGKSNSMFSSKNTDDLEELFKSDLKKSEAQDKKDDDPGEDLFGSSNGRKPVTDTSRSRTDDSLDIFKESAVTTSRSKTDFDDLFASPPETTKTAEAVTAVSCTEDALMTNGKSSRTSSDLDDLFSSNKPAAETVSADTKDTVDTVDGNAEIHVSPVTEPGKRKGSTDLGDPEPDELDFSVIEDTSLLDPNINRSKSSLRKRSSLARRKKPTRSSMRRVFQQTEDGLSVSPTSADKDEVEDQSKPEEEPEASVTKDEDKKPEVVKKCPVPGGKLLLGPDVLAQSQLLKGIGSKRGQPSTKIDKVDSETAASSEAKPESKQEQLPSEKPEEKPVEKPEEKVEKSKEKVEEKPELKEKTEEVATSSSSPEKEEPVGKKGPVGGRLVLGPDVLAQSQLLKGIGNKRGQPSSSAESVRDQTNGAPSTSDLDSAEDKQKPVIKLRKPQLSPRPKLSPPSDLLTTRSQLKEAQPGETKKGSSSVSQETGKGSMFPTVLKPTVPKESTSNKTSSMTLEKVNLRSTRSGSIETKVTSPTMENNVIHGELSERKNSLRRVSPGKSKEEDKREEKKDQPAWLTGMKLRKTSPGISDTSSSNTSPSKGITERTPVKTSEAMRSTTKVEISVSPKASTSVHTTTPRVPREDRPQPSLKPLVDRPKPKTEAKPSSVNGRGDASVSKPSLTVRDPNTTTEDLPAWKRDLAERRRKKKEDPSPSTPIKSDTQDVAANWRSQLSQKKRRSVASPAGDAKASPDSKQPEWAMQAEQRRARLVKAGLIGQK